MLTIGLGLLLEACAPSVEEVIERHRAPVEAKLAALTAIGEHLDDAGEPAGAPSEPLIFIPEDPAFNACALLREEFEDLASYHHPELPALGFSSYARVPAVTRVLHGPLDRDNATLADLELSRFQQVRYALVLLRNDWQPGVVGGFQTPDPSRPGQGVFDRTFHPGYFRGEALLFELQSGRLLLRFHVEAEHDPEFVFFRGSDPEKALRDHLAGKIQLALAEAVAAAVPGSRGP